MGEFELKSDPLLIILNRVIAVLFRSLDHLGKLRMLELITHLSMTLPVVLLWSSVSVTVSLSVGRLEFSESTIDKNCIDNNNTA